MPVVTVAPELYKRVAEAAATQESTVDAIINEAAQHYLWELDRDKISAEMTIYRQSHPELKEQYAGEYIAMHRGEVVDHDTDESALWQRIRQRFGDTAVMVTLVGEMPERALLRRGFRLENPLS